MESPYSDTNAGLHYDLRLELDPQARFIAVSGSIAYHSPQHRLERARFYLHRQFAIQRIEGRRVLGYQYEPTADAGIPFLPQAGVLDVYFDPPLSKDETALIQFSYSGTITDYPAESANVIGPDWVELGMYLPWFPLQYSGKPSDLTFTLKVKCPAGYQIGSYGRSSFQDSTWVFSWLHPTSDIVVVAGPTLETRQFASPPNNVILHTANFSEPAANRLGEDLLWTVERFAGWFGPTRPTDFTLIESPRALGGGYARRGMVVLAGINERDYLDQREAYLRYLAHEAAHAWWWEAPTNSWEDWLNESFAEYSALLAVRERFGPETFDRFLERKNERSLNGTPLWGFDRLDTSTPEKQAMVERMLYDKGPLALHDLAEKIGYPQFLEFCRARLWSGVTETAHLLDLLEEVENNEARARLEKMLKS